jgi:hypoxanthine phosphoribosyltransferase
MTVFAYDGMTMTDKQTDTNKDKLYERILFTNEQVDAKIDELAGLVVARYRGQKPLFVCLLRGGVPFSHGLMTAITRQDPYFHPELDYMTIRTYGDERVAKDPEVVMDLGPHRIVKGRPLVIVDDLLDTGATASFAASLFLERGATSVDVCVLARKQKQQTQFDGAVMCGFETPDVWLTGMGMNDSRLDEYGEANRWGHYIAEACSDMP